MSASPDRSALWRRLAVAAIAIVILAAMGVSLWNHGGPMLRAAAGLNLAALGVSLGLCLIYRVVNAAGWGLILGALGEPAQAVPAARVWLASEACRWLPGSLWSFGSRAVLASRRGLPGSTVGLVVREACLSAMLTPWMPAEQALAVALAWRMLQILAEIACFAVVAAWGLPASLGSSERTVPGPHTIPQAELVATEH